MKPGRTLTGEAAEDQDRRIVVQPVDQRMHDLGDEAVHGIWFVVGRDGTSSHTPGG